MEDEKITILVVDDDTFVRDMIADILESEGYPVKTAENGKEGRDAYFEHPGIGLIISDMNMPVMNGLELIHEIRSRKTDVPIIILTANNEISVALDAIKSGANDYLLKDENIQDTILLSVEKVIEKYMLKKQNTQLLADLAKTNAELKTSNEELAYLNQLKNKFIGIAAHDLRSPLSAIKGFSELLIEEFDELSRDESKEYIAIMNHAAIEMLELVNDLLDVSIIESGKLEIQLEKLNIQDLLVNRVRLNRTIAEKKNIQIHMDMEAVPAVLFDPNRIGQVFDNFMSNAIKYSPLGSSILIALKQVDDMIQVSFRDQGPGLSEDDQSKLFGEFQRLSAQPTGGEKSTGLGLAIVKKVIDAHHGKVDVQSRIGEGSTFSFSIPICLHNHSIISL